jgi:hypothetical protein
MVLPVSVLTKICMSTAGPVRVAAAAAGHGGAFAVDVPPFFFFFFFKDERF